MTGPAHVVVLAVGNRFAGDDGVAFAVLEAARADLPEEVVVKELDGEAARILDAWEGCRAAVIVDAARSGSPTGTVHRVVVDAPDPSLAWNGPGPRVLGLNLPVHASSHGAGVAEALALGGVLGRRPQEVVLVGIEGARFGPGDGLSHEVVHAVPGAVRLLVAELERLTATTA